MRLAKLVLTSIAIVATVGAASSAWASYSGIRLWNPKMGGHAVDWCLYEATQCGAPAATSYCRSQGYGVSDGYKGQKTSQVTFIMGSGTLCTRDRFDHCDRFTYIDCKFH